jgi:hypothetical protein
LTIIGGLVVSTLLDGTTPVHIKLMKDTPTVKKETTEKPVVQNTELQREIYLRLVSSAAADGRFLLGNLPNAQAVVKQGDHLKGVAEILAKCYEQ